MKFCEGQIGRVFVLRLGDGDKIPDCIEDFAEENGISVGHAILIGESGGGKIGVGPENLEERPPKPVFLPIDNAYETAGVGVIAPDRDGKPRLHMHGTFGRSDKALTGCMKSGVIIWFLGEVIIYEITGIKDTKDIEHERFVLSV
jgi:predicted DNA-binding protein with PD1-like motif